MISITTVLVIISLAKLIGDLTDHLDSQYGDTMSLLLNVNFGNAEKIEIRPRQLIQDFIVCKGIIIGYNFGKTILIFGLSILAEGIKNKEEIFNKRT